MAFSAGVCVTTECSGLQGDFISYAASSDVEIYGFGFERLD